jgi:hypothetical protein
MRIEDERAQRDVVRIFRRRDARDDRFEDLIHVDALFGGDAQDRFRRDTQQAAHIFSHFVGTRRGQVNFVDDGDEREIGVERLI